MHDVGPRRWRAPRRAVDAGVAVLCLLVLCPLVISFAIAASPWGAAGGWTGLPGGWLAVTIESAAAMWFAVVGVRYAACVIRPETLELDGLGLVHRTPLGGETRATWKRCSGFVLTVRTWPGDGTDDEDQRIRRQLVMCPTGTLEPARGVRAGINRAFHPRLMPVVVAFRAGQGPWGLTGSDLVYLLDRYRRTFGPQR